MSAWTEGWQPGEWRVAPCPSRRVDQWEIHWSAHGECVAETVHGKANADLFAASKHMARALLAIRASDEDWKVLTPEQREAVDAALSLASGGAK